MTTVKNLNQESVNLTMRRDPRLHMLDAPGFPTLPVGLASAVPNITSLDMTVASGALKYIACIYERAPGCYDIRIMIGEGAKGPLAIPSGGEAGIVRFLWRDSHRRISLPKLCIYMNRKFKHFQPRDSSPGGPGAQRQAPGVYLGVCNSLAWIESVITVEFDYHIGDADCGRPEHAEMLSKYCSDITAGWYV